MLRSIFVLLGIAVGCHGVDPEPEMMSHLVLVDQLPAVFRNNVTTQIEIRTNYSGDIEFRESDEFKVLLNITAPSIQEAYAVTSDIADRKGRLLLQVYQKPIVATPVTLEWIFILVTVAGGTMMLLTILVAVWWYSTKKYLDVYMGNSHLYRSRNSMQLGAAAGELMGDADDRDADFDGEIDDNRKSEKQRVAMKPETILEETEDDSDDESTHIKSRFKVSSKHLERTWSQRTKTRELSNENAHGSGILDYPDQSGDELDDDVSPQQKIADAGGNYTPLDELDDCIHGHESGLHSAHSAARLPDPKGNLDFNIHNSKSDGDLIDRSPKKFSERTKVIPPLTVTIPKHGTCGRVAPVRRKAEPNIYEKGLSLKPPRSRENDLSGPGHERTQAHVHTSEYSNPSRGQYITLQSPPESRSRHSREPNNAFEMYTYPAETPLTTFKAPTFQASMANQTRESPAKPAVHVKPTPMFTSGSPGTYDYENLQPSFRYPLASESKLPLSPGDFSMLNEDSSGNSSSDIDDDDDKEYLRLDDSDLEIPPIDHEGDMLSNNSLPLPSPPPMTNQFVPYDVTGQILQLSPRQSLISPADEKDYGTMIALTGSPSPGGPFSRNSVNAGPDGSAFVFPPPPVMFNPPQQTAWSRRELFRDDSGEYVGLPMEMTSRARHDSDRSDASQRERDRERRLSGGKRGKFPKHLTHLAILSVMSILSLMSGVYCATKPAETSVNIIVFLPKNVQYRNSTLYTGIGKTVDVDDSSKMNWFVSNNPILGNVNSDLCVNHTCVHGCDDNGGACLCRHGYQMENGICNDINECYSGLSRSCHPNAGCANTAGSYECLCLATYNLYWYNNKCLECSADCQKGSYEVQPCKGTDQKKICRECTVACPDNYYMNAPCRNRGDARCFVCQPKCDMSKNEFEFSQCGDSQNRACRDRSALPAPTTSSNVILDDLTLHRVETIEFPYVPLNFDGVRRSVFARGLSGSDSDFWIEVDITHFSPTGIFTSVDHADAVDPSQTPAVTRRYCHYPVPSHYELKYTVHEDVSYKGNTTMGVDSIAPCEGDTSNYPDLAASVNSSIFCSEPGPISSGFQMKDSDYSATATVWQERSERCRQQHEECESCAKNCAIEMSRSKNECSVSGEDANGRSPRLPICFSCCVKNDCADKCRNYHSDGCEMVRCNRGNLVQFQLSPVYPTSDNFYCHVEQVKQRRLIDVEYRVKYPKWTHRRSLLNRNISVHGNDDWQRHGKVTKRDDIINIEIDGSLRTMPNFIQGAIGARNVRVGVYEAQGTPMAETFVQDKAINIRPDSPFGINPWSFGSKRCRDDVLRDVTMLTSNEGPISVIPELYAVYKDGSYIIANRTTKPTVRIGIKKNTSILKAIFPPTVLVKTSLTGSMTYNTTNWTVTVRGRILTCPGFLNLNITDPSYKDHPLYQFDVGVDCPEDFRLTLYIPTGDSLLVSKFLQIQVRDDNSTYTLTVHTPASLTQRQILRDLVVYETPVTDEPVAQEPAHFSVLFISVVSGAVLVLLFLLLFGVAWKQGIPEGNLLRFRVRHLALLVIYMTVQFVFAVVVSMTVFVLVIIAVNGETTTFLRQYNHQRSVKTALSQLELDRMERHLVAEILRQDTEVTARRRQCHVNIQHVLADVDKMRKEMEKDMKNLTERQNIKSLVTAHTQSALHQFKEDVGVFKKNYDSYERFILHKLTLEVDSTYQSLQHSKWLAGAVYLHKSVSNIREFLHSDSNMMPFMQWANMETDMTDLANGLRLPIPQPPDLQNKPEAIPNTVPFPGQRTNTAPLPTQVKNQWIIQPSFDTNTRNKMSLNFDQKQERVTTLNSSSYVGFLVVMVVIDILWLLHRMIKAGGIGKLLLYGYPIYVDVRDKKVDSDGRENEETPTRKICVKMCSGIWSKMFSTFFIPKLIGTLFICLLVYCVSISSYKFINRRTFSYLGYYTNMDDIMKLNEAAINTRINAHAARINRLQFPMYESMMNNHVSRHQNILTLVERRWGAIRESHTATYCHYLRRINVTATCETNTGRSDQVTEVQVDECLFPPIVPECYYRTVSSSIKIAQAQMDGFLLNIRKLISDTCHVILIYLAAVVMKELLGTVLWLYIKRSGFVSLRIIYETDEMPGTADTSTNK